jgi:hypothetical protein
VAVQIGDVQRDFTVTSAATDLFAANPGDTVTVRLDLQRLGSSFGGSVALSLDGPLPTGIGAVSFSPSSLTPANGNGADSTLSINAGTLAPGSYSLVVRATGTNGDSTPHVVTHLLPLTLYVGSTASSGSNSYVDLTGFAVMRITYTDTNRVDAYAISGVYADENDPALRRGQAAKLVPWS